MNIHYRSFFCVYVKRFFVIRDHKIHHREISSGNNWTTVNPLFDSFSAPIAPYNMCLTHSERRQTVSDFFFAFVSGLNSKITIFLNFFVGKNNVYLSGKKNLFSSLSLCSTNSLCTIPIFDIKLVATS